MYSNFKSLPVAAIVENGTRFLLEYEIILLQKIITDYIHIYISSNH